jgi:hypothetical protein
MGRIVQYELELKIKASHVKEAIELFNQLHTDEMLLEFAQGGIYGCVNEDTPVRERKWYSWVENPKEPYTTLEGAFINWNVVDDDIIMEYDENGDFYLSGTFYDKLGQQKLLFQHLASVLEDMKIFVKDDDYGIMEWVIENHFFSEIVHKKYW